MKVFIGVRHEETDLSAVGHLVGGGNANLVEVLACQVFLEAHGIEFSMSRTTD